MAVSRAPEQPAADVRRPPFPVNSRRMRPVALSYRHSSRFGSAYKSSRLRCFQRTSDNLISSWFAFSCTVRHGLKAHWGFPECLCCCLFDSTFFTAGKEIFCADGITRYFQRLPTFLRRSIQSTPFPLPWLNQFMNDFEESRIRFLMSFAAWRARCLSARSTLL